MSQLSYARYGKDNVRLYKVDKEEKTGIHTVTEQTICILLEGDIDASYDFHIPVYIYVANIPAATRKQTTP